MTPTNIETYIASVLISTRTSRYEKTEHYFANIENCLKVLPDSFIVKPLGNVAYHAYYNISHSPELRAIALESDYIGGVASLYKELQEAGTKDIDAEVSRYAEQLHAKYSAWLTAMSRTMSAFIVGPANFPVARNEKAQRVEHKRNEELIEWDKKARTAIKKTFGIHEPGYKEVISSDDPEAINKLKVKLESEKQSHARAIEGNKILYNRKMSNIEKIEALKLLGFPEIDCDFNLKNGYKFNTVNSNAEIKRIEGRIKDLETKKTRQTIEQDCPGGKLIQNVEINRIQFIFNSKPDADTISLLESHGFKWAPSQSAWQRQLTPNAIFATKHYILKKLNENTQA